EVIGRAGQGRRGHIRGHVEQPVFNNPVRRDENRKRAPRRQQDEFHLLDRRFRLGREDKPRTGRKTGKKRAGLLEDIGQGLAARGADFFLYLALLGLRKRVELQKAV